MVNKEYIPDNSGQGNLTQEPTNTGFERPPDILHSGSKSSNSVDSLDDSFKDEDFNDVDDLRDDLSDRRSSHHSDNSFSDRSSDGGDNYDRPPVDNDDNESLRLREMLRKNSEQPPKMGGSAPTLAELQSKGQYQNDNSAIPDITQTTPQEEEDLKRELLFKFELLKKYYKGADVPEFSIHSDYETMSKTYEMSVRRLSLDGSVESYKTYLIFGFMGVEFALGKFLKLDMKGFSQQQIASMHTYEKLLVELGEKSYVPGDSKWPVELRLLFTVVIQAAIFIFGKMMMKKTGTNVMSMMSNFTNQAQTSVKREKKKMRGPSINLDDINDLDEDDE